MRRHLPTPRTFPELGAWCCASPEAENRSGHETDTNDNTIPPDISRLQVGAADSMETAGTA